MLKGEPYHEIHLALKLIESPSPCSFLILFLEFPFFSVFQVALIQFLPPSILRTHMEGSTAMKNRYQALCLFFFGPGVLFENLTSSVSLLCPILW